MKIYDNIWALKYVKYLFIVNIFSLILTIVGLHFFPNIVYETNPIPAYIFDNYGYWLLFLTSFGYYIFFFYYCKKYLIYNRRILSILPLLTIIFVFVMVILDFTNNVQVLGKVLILKINTILYSPWNKSEISYLFYRYKIGGIYMATKLSINNMFDTLLYIVFGFALIPVIYTLLTAANITDPAVASIAALVPLFFILGLAYASVKGLI